MCVPSHDSSLTLAAALRAAGDVPSTTGHMDSVNTEVSAIPLTLLQLMSSFSSFLLRTTPAGTSATAISETEKYRRALECFDICSPTHLVCGHGCDSRSELRRRHSRYRFVNEKERTRRAPDHKPKDRSRLQTLSCRLICVDRVSRERSLVRYCV